MTTRSRPLRLTTLSLALGAFALGVSEFAAMGLLPYFAADLGVSDPEAGAAVSAYALGVVIGAPLCSVLGAGLPRKRLLLLLVAVIGLGNLANALVPGMGSMVVLRFVSGLPHGAYLGVAALYAADFWPEGRKAVGVTRVLMGLTVANVIGVPLAGAAGQVLGWRVMFVAVAVLSAAAFAMILRCAPDMRQATRTHPLKELGALLNRDVLMVLGTGAIGFGGVFAVYTFFSAAILDLPGAPAWAIPLALSGFGIGGILGNLVVGRLAEWSPLGTTLLIYLFMALVALAYAAALGHWPLMVLAMVLLGPSTSISTPLHMRLMAVAGEAQTMAAALNHAAFNAANAIGAFCAGAVLARGYGWAATGQVGAALALAGIVMVGLTHLMDRGRRAAGVPPQA